jgi:hypothetical protein
VYRAQRLSTLRAAGRKCQRQRRHEDNQNNRFSQLLLYNLARGPSARSR